MTSPGDTYFGRLLDSDRRGHLWIVASAPVDGGLVAIVNLTTHFPGQLWHSDSCVLFAFRDHPFLNRDSCIAAPFADTIPLRDLEERLESRLAESREPLQPGVLRRIQDAALASPGVQEQVKAAIRDTLSAGHP